MTRSGPRVAGAAILIALTMFGLFGQSGARLEFEVASIKPSKERGLMVVRLQPGGRLTGTAPLRLLIQNAYSLQSFQIVGGPGWIDSDLYEIDARGEGNASRPQVFLMLQSLLEDRFRLRTHRETRELPVYALVAAKSGPKLSPPNGGSCRPMAPDAPTPPPPGPGQLPPCGGVIIALSPAGLRMQGASVPMQELARTLAVVLGRTVIDKTGVTRKFDVQLEFTPDAATAGLPIPVRPVDPAGAPPTGDSATPTIFTALQEQMGLKLESTRGPVEVLMIDRVERPTEN